MLGILVARFLFVFLRLFELLFLYTFTEPILTPIRNFLFRFRFFQTLPIDFSPLLVFVLLDVIRSLLIQIL